MRTSVFVAALVCVAIPGYNQNRANDPRLKELLQKAKKGDEGARATISAMYLIGDGVEQNFEEAARWASCPTPASKIMSTCQPVTTVELPQGAADVLKKLKCENFNGWGTAVDLNGDGEPEYEVCCHIPPHGGCGAVLISKIGGRWRDVSPKYGTVAFESPCAGTIILESQHNGYRDLCMPNECDSAALPGCVRPIYQFRNGRYESMRSGRPKGIQDRRKAPTERK